jgi:Iron-containing redox enzyme
VAVRASTVSQRLRRKVDLASGPFGRACARLVNHPRIAEVWPEYLIANHAIIRATVPLMETTRDRAAVMSEEDEVAAGVATYLNQHIVEELDHDQWLLQDLALLGVERDRVEGGVPSPAAAALVGSQYYWVLHVHPVAILGYLAFMEGFPPARPLIEDLIERTGYPRESFRTVVEHGELDHGHRDELDRTIDALPLTEQQEILLGVTAISGLGLLATAIEEVLEDAGDD